MCSKSHIIHIGCRLTILRHCDRTVPELEVVDTVRALSYCKERLTVSSLDAHYKHILAVPLDGARIECGIDAETLEIRAVETTGNRIGDAPVLPDL